MADVKPLRRRKTIEKLKSQTAATSAAEPDASAPLLPGRPPRPATPAPLAQTLTRTEPELRHGVAPGVDKRTLVRLRRGQFSVEGEIDLHRHTQEAAYVELEAFLTASQEAGRRCVLVITGKGIRPDRPVGVLRNAVPRWLNLLPNRARVLAFCHATSAHGGEGALYVLLRRRK